MSGELMIGGDDTEIPCLWLRINSHLLEAPFSTDNLQHCPVLIYLIYYMHPSISTMDGSEFFEEPASFSSSAVWADDIFWENSTSLENSSAASFEFQNQKRALPTCKKRKVEEGQQKISHITVERNRRKQMNDHLSVLRSLMPSLYVKRCDQASIIGGAVDYINEVQQLLQSLETKKQRNAAAYNDVVLLSPRTPLPSSTYKPRMVAFLNSPLHPSPCNSSTSSINNELVATSKSASAQVEVKFSGPNLLLKTVSPRIPGQVVKIISAIEELALEMLHVSISTVDETMLNSFTIKIGIQCQLSAEELAQQIQRTF